MSALKSFKVKSIVTLLFMTFVVVGTFSSSFGNLIRVEVGRKQLQKQMLLNVDDDVWNITGTIGIIDTSINITTDVYIYGTLYISNTTLYIDNFKTIHVMSGGTLEIINSKLILNPASLSPFAGTPAFHIYGMPTSTIHFTATTFNFAQVTINSAQIEIRDCVFMQPNIGLLIYNTTNVIIQNTTYDSVYHGLNSGIFLYNVNDSLILNNTIRACLKAAIIVNHSYNITIEQNIVQRNSGYALVLFDAHNITLSNNFIVSNRGGTTYYNVTETRGITSTKSNGGGIYVTQSSDVVFGNNTLVNDTILLGDNDFSSIVIQSNNKINGNGILFLYNKSDIILENVSYGEIFIISCDNVTLQNVIGAAIELYNTSNVQGRTILLEDGSFGFSVLNSSNVTVRNMTIRNFAYGIYTNYVSNLYLVNQSINYATIYGMDFVNTENVTLNEFIIRDAAVAIYDKTVVNSTITQGKITFADVTGIHLEGCSLLKLENLTITNSSTVPYDYATIAGIRVENSYEITITGNHIYFELMPLYSTYDSLKYIGIYVQNSHNITISENCIMNTGVGIQTVGDEYLFILENNISSSIGLAIGSFDYYSADKRVTVESNRILNSNIGIYLILTKETVIEANVFYNASLALLFQGITNTTVNNNKIFNGVVAISPSYITIIPYEFTPAELNFTSTNQIDNKPIVYFYGKSSVSLQNQTLGEILAFNCKQIEIKNVAVSGIFIDGVSSVLLSNITLDKPYFGIILSAPFTGESSAIIENVTIRNSSRRVTDISDNSFIGVYSAGINIHGFDRAIISNIWVDNWTTAIYLTSSSNIEISGSSFINNKLAIAFSDTNELNITRNEFLRNELVLKAIGKTTYVYVYLNNFISNKKVLDAEGNVIHFDFSNMGNYWDTYSGSDMNNDGIGDTPYEVADGYVDNYPLIRPYNATYFEQYKKMQEQNRDA